MEVNFSIATIDDVEEIIMLCNEVFEESTSLEYAKKVFKETENSDNDIYVVGRVNGQVVAHAKVTVLKTMYEEMNTYAILNHVCVKSELRRHNIATKMLDYITDICKQHKCVKMALWSKNVRVAAHACYKNYGFDLDEAGFFSKKIG